MKKAMMYKSIISIFVIFVFLASSFLISGATKTEEKSKSVLKKRIIVKLKDVDKKEEVSKNVKKKLKLSKLEVKKELKSKKISVYEIGDDDSIESVMNEFEKSECVEFVQEDCLLQSQDIPVDTRFSEQWWLNNSGQAIGGQSGISGVDINVLDAWEKTKGSGEVLVGVLDTGIDIYHTDLEENIYINTGEIPDDGLDNDYNGFIDDYNGWDFINNDNSVYDSDNTDRHGSHVAGIIAAEENGQGVCGTAPNVKILPAKFLSGKTGYTSDVLEAISYCEYMGVDIINCSWGGVDENQLLKETISNSSMIFICASGNMGTDSVNIYPASYDLPNVISVAAMDNKGNIASFSNYGSEVDVAAPGVGILSTLPGNSYGYLSGSSMSTPVVSGIAALVKSYCPDIQVNEIARRIKNNVVVTPKLNGKVSSSGMVEAAAVINDIVPEPKNASDFFGEKGIEGRANVPNDNTMEANGKIENTIIIDGSEASKRQVRPQNIGLTTVSQNVYTQSVSSLSYFCEEEPNNYSSEAMSIGTGTTYGTIFSSTDEDWYVVNLEANKQYTFSLRGLQQGDDLDLFLFNPNLLEVGASMTIGNGNENIVFTTATAGNYYVSTYCFSYATSDYHNYQLMIYPNDEFEPNNSQGSSQSISNGIPISAAINVDTDIDWYYIDVASDARITATLDNIPYDCDYDIVVYNQNIVEVGGSYFAGNISEKVNILVGSPGRYYIKVFPYSGSHPGLNYELRASVSNPDQYETNDFDYEAKNVPVGSSIFATIDNIKDVDLFEVPIYQQGFYSFSLEDIPSDRDYDIYIYDPSGSYLDGSYSFENNDENIVLELGTGNYCVKVVPFEGASDSLAYNLSINQYSVLTASMPDISAEAEDYIEVPITLQNIPQEGICSFDLKLSYDSNALTYIDYVSGNPLALTGINGTDIMEIGVEDTNDGLRILYIDNSSTFTYPIINSENIVTLRFQVNSGVSDGIYEIGYSEDWAFAKMLDGYVKDVNIVRFKSGTVTIGDYQQLSLSAFEERERVISVMYNFSYGDLNRDNKYNSTDYSILRRFVVDPYDSLAKYGIESLLAGDLNGTGNTNSTDYALLRRYLLGVMDGIEELGGGCVIYKEGYDPQIYYGSTTEAEYLVAHGGWRWEPDIPQSVQSEILGVSGDQNIILTQGCLAVMRFPLGNSGPNGNGVDANFGMTSKFWLIEFKHKMGLNIYNSDGEIQAIIDAETLSALYKAVREDRTMQSMGIQRGTNPNKQEVINYITQKCNEKGVPVRLGLATAWTESDMKQFNDNGASGPNASNDWGLMQINSHSHYAAFNGAFDNNSNTPDIVRNWRDNVDYGIDYLLDSYDWANNRDNGIWGATGISLGESKMGPYSQRTTTNLARSAYACYNSGSIEYRYRLTENEASAQGKSTWSYDATDTYGYDLRDNNFWAYYWNQSWN